MTTLDDLLDQAKSTAAKQTLNKAGIVVRPTTASGKPMAGPLVEEAKAALEGRYQTTLALDEIINQGKGTKEIENIYKGGQAEPNIFLKGLGKVVNLDLMPGAGKFTPIRSGLTGLDTGRRVIVSTIKEVDDAIAGKGFSGKDWFEQANIPKTSAYDPDRVPIGFGDMVSTGNIWTDRLLGFVGDVLLDPVTYVTGPGGIVKTAAQKGAVTAGGRFTGKAAAATATKISNAVSKEAAAYAAKVLAEDAVRLTADDAARAAAQKTLNTATKELDVATRQVQRFTPTRVRGANAREALSQSVRQVRDDAVATLADPLIDDVLRAQAQGIVDNVTDKVIGDIAVHGYGALLPSFREILQGARTPAAEALGVQGGLRFGLGSRKVVLPGTERLTNVLTKAVPATRLTLVNTKAGRAVLDRIIPRGAGGLFGDADIFKLRQGLRTGTLRGANAADAAQILSLDKTFRGELQVARKDLAKGIARELKDLDDNLLEGIKDHLSTPKTQWASAGLRPLNAAEQAAYDGIERFYDSINFYLEEATAGAGGFAATGGRVARPLIYLPQTQSDQAVRWIANNPDKAIKLAADLGVDNNFFGFSAKSLNVGDKWWGRTLTPDDVAEGIPAFNRIANEGGFKGEFFETNVKRALVNYSESQARRFAYTSAVSKLPVGGVAGGAPNLAEVVPTREIDVPKPSDLGSFDTVMASLTEDTLKNWNKTQLDGVVDSLRKVVDEMSRSNINKIELQKTVDDLLDRINTIEAGVASGVIDPSVGALASDQITDYANALARDARNVQVRFVASPPDRWKALVNMTGDVLRPDFIPLTEINAPNIAARQDIAEMLTNVQRLNDPQFALAAERALREVNQLFKSYATASVGFHVRNSISNIVALVAAGATPANIARGHKLYIQLERSFGKEPLIDILQRIGRTPAEREAILNTYQLFAATGFGQFGEVAEQVGTRATGVFGGRARNKLSEYLGMPIGASRKVGQGIENAARFALVFDGIKQGLSPQEAAGRAAKYLVDYSDLSTLDRNIKQIIPFWMWISRNVPLQAEIMWTNPRVYSAYNSFRNNFENEEETSPYLPNYYRKAGAFGIGGGWYLRPDVGLSGLGRENPLQTLITQPTELLSSITPGIRAPYEAFLRGTAGEKFFSGAPVVDKDLSEDERTLGKLLYVFQQFGGPQILVKRVLDMTPVRRNTLYQRIAGTKTFEDTATQQQWRSLLQFIGSPAFKLTEREERNEIWRRFFELGSIEDKLNEKQKKMLEEGIVPSRPAQSPVGTIPEGATLDDLLNQP